MLVGVCDFPGSYAFPPSGYGGIERWLWASAIGARRTGAEVHLLGPQWRQELDSEWVLRPIRLESLTPGERQVRGLRDTGYDLLVVGHEYPSLPAWRVIWEALDCDVATFQHWPYFDHQPCAFDGLRSRLYCYSPEMRDRYAAHHPILELAVHLGLREIALCVHDDGDLLWLGRIDAQKAPHLAICAAGALGRKITIAGPVLDAGYFAAHRAEFSESHVTMIGEVGDDEKARLLAEAGALVYTCARDYIEAGAATFGEALRAGTPVAALAWRPGTCAHAALCPRTGAIALLGPSTDDILAARALADAIEQVASLRAQEVREIGMARFDAAHHFRVLASRPC
jgi:glycosyltransferase involved in cell wall biosynthesis